MAVRPRFDKNRALAASRPFTYAGRPYAVGDPFPHPDDPRPADRALLRQYEARAVHMTDDQVEAADADPITMTGPAGGRYTINAPWFETPLVVRGKANADKALAEVREEGAPLGWIDGGSEVEVEGGDGGWYQISAPWLAEPEKVQGREAAEARQRELHEAGAPEDGEGEQEENDDMDDTEKDRLGIEREGNSPQGRPVDGQDHEPNTHEGPDGNAPKTDGEEAAEDSADDDEGGDGASRPIGP